MTSSSRTLLVSRPIGEVFAFFADAERDHLWRTEVLETRRRGTARYEQRVEGPGGRAMRADIEVKDYVRNERITFRGMHGPLRQDRTFTFTERGERTLVTLTVDARAHGLARMRPGEVEDWIDRSVGSIVWAQAFLEARTQSA